MQPLLRTRWRLLRKLRITVWSSSPVPGIYPDETVIQQGTRTPVHSRQKHGNNPNVHQHILMDKEDVVCTHNGILLSHKQEPVMPFAATWMQLEIII